MKKEKWRIVDKNKDRLKTLEDALFMVQQGQMKLSDYVELLIKEKKPYGNIYKQFKNN